MSTTQTSPRCKALLALALLTACGSDQAGGGDSGTPPGGATCLPAPAEGSIHDQCTTQHRTCSEPTKGQATCGACLTGFAEIMGNCTAAHACADLQCDAQHRACDENPTGHCTTCLTGFVQDAVTMNCRAPKSCTMTTCGLGTHCVEQAGADATCVMGTGCPAGKVPTPQGNMCATCGITCTGRAGGTGQVYQDLTTDNGDCICETMPGYYWDNALIDIRPCDEDQDGWIRLNVKQYFEGTDVALKTNARCDVKTIDRVIYQNDQGEAKTVMLANPLSLYESERTDSPSDLHALVTTGALPTYRGRELKAEELNALTKACVGTSRLGEHSDFNDNQAEDVDEAHGMPPTSSALSVYLGLTYFMETHRGYYEPPAASGAIGAYRIREKSRSEMELDPGLQIPFTYGATTTGNGPYWRQCDRLKDSTYVMGLPGFDFEEEDPMTSTSSTWHGMNHASQFRCIRLVSGAPTNTNQLSAQTIQSEWVVERCSLGGTNPPVAVPGFAGRNPSDPAVSCSVLSTLPSTSSVSPVLWALAKYAPYNDAYTTYPAASYVRGCVNECKEYPFRCPGFDPSPSLNHVQCVGDLADFGLLHCGCTASFGGPSCEIECAGGGSLAGTPFVSQNFNAAPRVGQWLCGRVAGSSGEAFGPSPDFTLRGEVPVNAFSGGPMCEQADCSTGWRVTFTSPIQ